MKQRATTAAECAKVLVGNGHLSIAIEQYKPKVKCFNDELYQPNFQECLFPLSQMPVPYKVETFGETGEGNVDEVLPQRFSSGENSLKTPLEVPAYANESEQTMRNRDHD